MLDLYAGNGEEGAKAAQPRVLRSIRGAHFARVAAGATHSLALTSSGQVYSFGEGSFGALGMTPCTSFWATKFPARPTGIWRLHVESCSERVAGQGLPCMDEVDSAPT